ncbi:MAG: hypothetical protein AAF196_13920 [Planctomycetota bacterium]
MTDPTPETDRAAQLEHLLRNLLAVIQTQGEVAETMASSGAWRSAFGYVQRAADEAEARIARD